MKKCSSYHSSGFLYNFYIFQNVCVSLFLIILLLAIISSLCAKYYIHIYTSTMNPFIHLNLFFFLPSKFLWFVLRFFFFFLSFHITRTMDEEHLNWVKTSSPSSLARLQHILYPDIFACTIYSIHIRRSNISSILCT